MRAWIEIPLYGCDTAIDKVALFMRAWIEIHCLLYCHVFTAGRPLHEGVD